MTSLTHRLVLLILKLKGVKKDFSQHPIDVKKIRQEDIHQPKHKQFSKSLISQFEILETTVTEIKPQQSTDKKLLLFIHGGAFISGPAKHHWDTIKQIKKHTNTAIWMCDYPKAPEAKIDQISKNIDAVYASAAKKYDSSQITLIGDSVGGTLATALTQRLILKGIAVPKKLILISPVMDATISNPEIEIIDKIDPMLSKMGVLSAKKMCAENNNLNDVMISPLNGSFERFPNTILFLAENDITYPDQQIAVQKLDHANVAVEVIIGKKMPHIWPLLPVMSEAKSALKKIISHLN